MSATLWVDVEDLFHYARVNARPSGIQRVAFEISRTLYQRHGDRGMVRFVRYDSIRDTFRVVEWPEIVAVFEDLAEARPPAPRLAVPTAIAPPPRSRRFIRKWVHRLPEASRVQLTELLLTHERALRVWARLFASLGRGVADALRRSPGKPRRQRPRASARKFDQEVARGDTLLTLGAPWSQPEYAALIRRNRDRHGLRYALLIYDIIPLRRPEWCDRGLVRVFREFFAQLPPMCDTVLAISRATAADVRDYANTHGLRLTAPVIPIPMGSGFGEMPTTTASSRTARLPAAGTYALFVSTIEARKNHLLMFRVWRRLLESSPAAEVPTLVFAGRVGWLVDDLMRQIANADYLDGKLVIVEDPSDAELAALYQGCRFTVFPSLYEGWGLPVTESLTFGKPCLIADRTSLPEAGGTLARRFDPDDLNDAFAAIREVIRDAEGLAAWEAKVRREFRRVPWSVTTDALLSALGFASAAAEPRVVPALTESPSAL